ncbi:MAG: GNAT family N-acetyltransferase [Candidatus Tectomicrobia bacterium]|nr:GNAT family N-acetyltransferase [Candidatus Tectomicrobia bacterium]
MSKKTLCLFEVDLKTVQLPVCEARLDVEYRVLDAAAWTAQPHTAHMTDRHLFQGRLDRGEAFWTAQQADRIVSYCWVTRDAVEIGEIRCLVRPRPDEVYLYDAFTFEEHRGRNLYPALMYRILEHSREAGRRRALIFVMSDNIASIRGVQKAGFVEFQRVTYSTLLGFGRYTYQPRLSEAEGVDLITI